MARSLNRRAFLKRAGAATAAVMRAPLISSTRPARAAAGDRLVVAVGQWGTETPFAWRTVQAEKPLWDCIYDPLIQRDPKTFEYRPGLATEWKPSNELKTWTFKLRSGVKFHEGWGELTAEDVKFTVEQNLKPDAGGGSSPFFRMQLDRIETPDKLSVVMHFKTRVWEVPSLFTQFVGYQNIVPKKYLETAGEEKAALHPIGTGPYRHVEGRQGDFHRFEAVANHWRKTPDFKELVIRRIPDPATRLTGLRAGEIDIGIVFGDYLDQAAKSGLRLHDATNAACYWVILSGQTTSDKEDYCPACPWAGDNNDPKSRNRKTNKTHWVYGSPPFDEPVLAWNRIIHSKGAFNLVAEGPFDEDIDTIMKEFDVAKRATLTSALGQKLYDGYYGVMLGMKSITWAMTRKVGGWLSLAYVPLENNYEYVSPAG